METILQDLKYAARQLGNNPGFTCAAVFALALGIGANTVIFSAVNAVLLNSLPFQSMKDPARLVAIYERNPAILQFISERLPVRLKNYLEWKKQNQVFSGIAAYADTNFSLASAGQGGNREPEQVHAATATSDFFSLLGVHPSLGREFAVNEMQPGRDHVTIISDVLWRSRFQGDPNILGRTIRATGADYRIVGVLPPTFELPASGQGLDQSKPMMWVPMHASADSREDNGSLIVYGRLKPGLSLAQARADMKVIEGRLQKAYPEMDQGWGINVFPLTGEDVSPDVRRGLYVLQVAVGFVLLIACANVANLLLTKAVAREREMSVRVALGASRWRIVRQMLSESLLLSFVGASFGLLLSVGALHLISFLAPTDSHGFHELRLDPLVLIFTLGITAFAGILFGLAPSLHSMSRGINDALSRGARSVGGASNRLRSALVIAEISLSLTLLVGAGLTLRSMASIMNLDVGFRPDHVLAMSIALPSYRYTKQEQVSSFNDQLLDRVEHLPGVRFASLSTALPMRTISEQSYQLPGVPFDPNKMLVTDWSRITEGHIDAVGMRLQRGRNLTRQDVLATQPSVALVNESFAHANWPNQDALGKTFLFNNEEGKLVPHTIVGILSNEHQFGPDSASHAQIYIPGHHMQSMSLVVRTTGDPLSSANSVKQQVWAVDKDQPVSEVDSMDNILYQWTAPRRFNMTILLNFAGVALVLAGVGLYSVLAYSVSLRRREIGIRIALGAQPGNVVGLVVGQGLKLTIIGLAIGVAGSFALTRFMESLIFGVSATDPYTFLVTPVLLAAIALIASYLPARRAAQIAPAEALRSE